MIGDSALYDSYTRSLRETLMPMTRFIQQVIATEIYGNSLMKAARTLEFPSDIDPDMWFMLPYPYDKPIYFDLVADKKRKGDPRPCMTILDYLDDDDIGEWKNRFYQRVSPLLDHALHDTTVGELDRDSRTGLLLSLDSGIIRQFSYDVVDGIELMITPVSTQGLLAYMQSQYLTNVLGNEGYQSYYNSLVAAQRYYYLDARLTGRDKEYDAQYRRDMTNWIHFSDKSVLSQGAVNRVATYLGDMFQHRAKCIIIP